MRGRNQISIEIVDENNNSVNNSLNYRKIEDNNKEECNKEENNDYQAKEKKEHKQDDMDFEIDEIEIESNNENENEKKPEKQNKVSNQLKKDDNDSKYKIEVINRLYK